MKRLLPLLLLPMLAHAATLDTSPFGKMIPFTISGYAGSSTLANFPVLVRLSTAINGFDYADFGATAADVRADLRFVDADGNSLDYEIDTWDPAGESLVWVSVPAVSGTMTRFYAYFKPDAGATLPAVDPTAVWTRAGYFGVWHFGEVDATDGSVADATGNGLTAAPRALSGAPNLRTDGAGVVGAYVKSNSGLVLPSAAISAFADTKTDYTVEAWVNRSVENGGDQQIMRSANTWNQGAGLRLNDRIFYGNSGYTQWSADYPVPLTGWTFLAGAFSTTQSGYLQLNDGYPLPSVTRGDNNTSFTAFSLTSRTGGTDEVFKGYADEFRLRRGLSSKDWSMAVYDSVRPGATFLHVDAVVTLDAGVVGLYGSATGVSFTAATIVGAFTAPDPTAYSATCTLTTNGVAVLAGLAAGTLGADGLVSVALDDLVPGTEYEFVFTVSLDEADVYSAGSFTTASLPTPTVSNVSETTAIASLAATLAGPSYAAGTVTAVFSPVLNGTTVVAPASFADGAWTAAATTLEADQDYTVAFVVAPSGAPSFASPSSAPFVTPGTARVSNTAFRWQMSVTATGYDGTETLEHFPVLVRVPAAIAATVPDPAGIRFALENGKLLPHEIEWWDPSGLSAIWVSVPSLSGTDTSFYMLWDPVPGAAVHGSLSPARIWTAAGYVGVWHFAAQNADGAYPDASGHGATAISIDATKMPNAPETATLSTNGTPWHLANIGLKVAPANTTDWTFSSTGYTTEAWLIPTSGYNRMFLYANGNYDGNTMAFSTSQVYVMNWNYEQSSWPGDVKDKSVWRFITTAWRHADADWTTRFYANAEQRSSWGSKNAADFTDHGMGLTSGTEGNGVMNYSVDELRVRRGNSTADWVQANYDTQVLGSDFLTYGEPERTQRATIVLIY